MQKRSSKLTEQKKNRIVAAVTANVVLLIVILVAVVVYQLAVIVRTARLKTELQRQITEYEYLIEEGKLTQEELERILSSDKAMFEFALKNGYIPGN